MTERETSRPPLEILLVEDNPGDVLLTREALKAVNLASRISVARDGEEALTRLRSGEAGDKAPRPDLILLDLNLPGMDGHQVLAEIRRDPGLQSIPVLILTSSTSAEDVARAGRMRAQGYVVKAVGLAELSSTVRTAAALWMRVARRRPGP